MGRDGVSQATRLLDILRARGEQGITPLEALDVIGSLRLAARIADVARLIEPDETIVNVGHRTEAGKVIARYVLRRRPRVESGVQESLW